MCRHTGTYTAAAVRAHGNVHVSGCEGARARTRKRLCRHTAGGLNGLGCWGRAWQPCSSAIPSFVILAGATKSLQGLAAIIGSDNAVCVFGRGSKEPAGACRFFAAIPPFVFLAGAAKAAGAVLRGLVPGFVFFGGFGC